MQLSDSLRTLYLDILREELQPAFGCTEPAALAYAAALARETLGALPERLRVVCSGNIIKNVKSVIVPNAGGLKGLEVAAAAGVIAGNAAQKLELLRGLTDEGRARLRDYLTRTPIEVGLSDSPLPFDIQVEAEAGGSRARVRIAGHHTNVVLLERDGAVLLERPAEEGDAADTARAQLTVAGIVAFADGAPLDALRPLLDRQIACNMAIAEEGLRGNYGANTGSVLLETDGSLRTRLKALAAAGSDARMSGCEMPVIINSGSGNQGITVSVPVVVYARAQQLPDDRLYRALALSNLLAIYQRSGIGCLSAYCGAINAGVAAACGVVYLQGGTLDDIAHTLVNGLAIVSGVICDGAKPSCAAKIAVGIDAGLMGHEMYRHNQQFYRGEGIVKHNADATVAAVARLGRYGMRETDREILHIMIDE